MSKTKFTLDGSDIGNIDHLINEKFFSENKKLHKVKLNNNGYLSLNEFDNEFPLILDTLKKYFNVFPTLYNIVYINNKKYLAYPFSNEISLSEYVNYNNKKQKRINSLLLDDIRNLFVFNWLMCVKNSYEILVRPFSECKFIDTKECDSLILFSIGEKTFHYLESDSGLPKTIINEWFEKSVELFYDYAIKMVKSINPDIFRNEITEIVNKHGNDTFVSWVNVVYNRIRDIKNL
jgi:hypothetical protein